MAEEDLAVQLEEWEASEEKQDAPLSAMDEQLHFESKTPLPLFPCFFYACQQLLSFQRDSTFWW